MDMRAAPLVLSLAVMLGGCAGNRQTARPAVGKTPVGLEKPLDVPSLAPLPLALFEPLGCALYVGDDPVYAAKDLACVVQWMAEAQDYLAKGGKPSQYTDQKHFDSYRKAAASRAERIKAWLSAAEFKASASPQPPAPAASANAPENTKRECQRHYLQGLIYYQKGDYPAAGKEWELARSLDPGDSDVQAALERLAKVRGGAGR